jgi:diaminohydroxyphosphoribosylaminopyrimidine deaminase/5-amino-6-(5-phosphoribosylamino)uracil reductase
MDELYMKRAINLARKGSGHTSPNPLVGAVIVKGNKIIGEGYHQYYGGNHAEVNAIESVTEDVEGGTIYVTLEPCSHFGKTPPCAKKIVESKLARVVIGMTDPNPLVAGRGIRILEEAGIEVVTGVLEEDIKELNEVFIKYILTKKPFCYMKYAMTLDGKIASWSGDSKWITSEKSRKYVHDIRQKVSAIMVGIGTVLADDPSLTTRRGHEMDKDAIRVILDTRCRIPLDARVLNLESSVRTIIATGSSYDEKIGTLKENGAEVIITPLKENRIDIAWLFEELGRMGIDSILLEGGATMNYSALEAGVVDRVMAFVAPKIIGGQNAKTPVEGEGIQYVRHAVKLADIDIKRFDQDILITGMVEKSEVITENVMGEGD